MGRLPPPVNKKPSFINSHGFHDGLGQNRTEVLHFLLHFVVNGQHHVVLLSPSQCRLQQRAAPRPCSLSRPRVQLLHLQVLLQPATVSFQLQGCTLASDIGPWLTNSLKCLRTYCRRPTRVPFLSVWGGQCLFYLVLPWTHTCVHVGVNICCSHT